MKLKASLTLLFITSFTISACSQTLFATPTSNPTATLTDTPAPTRTISPTSTKVLIDTIAPLTLAPTLEIRTGTPVANWHEIPIIPNAITGEERGSDYHYTTKTSKEKVRDYYVRTMQNQGWKYVDDLQSVTREEKFIYILSSNDNSGYTIEIVKQNFSEVGAIYIFEIDEFTHVMVILNQ